MTVFCREFQLSRLIPMLDENSWFTYLLSQWRPAGDAVISPLDDTRGVLARDHVKKRGEMEHLRAAFRDNYMNFYCGGQSIAKIDFRGDGPLRAEIHRKYVYGSKDVGQNAAKSNPNVTLTARDLSEIGTEGQVPCGTPQEWISNANNKLGHEKRFIDLIVAHNPNVIDLEMGLPACLPNKKNAPRMDLVALEPHDGGWRVVLWEVKRVGDKRARCKECERPEVLEQLDAYSEWISHEDNERQVAKAYQENCRLLDQLHAIAKGLRRDIEELGEGIQAVAAPSATPPPVDPKPRLMIVYDKNDKSFEGNGHADKLRKAGVHVQLVKNLRDVRLDKTS